MSNLKLKADITDRASALDFLDGRSSRKLGHNTFVVLRDGGDPAVTYHATDIVTYHGDGSVTFDCGGWATATTVDRMHRLTRYIANGRYPRDDVSRIEIREDHGSDPVATLNAYSPSATL